MKINQIITLEQAKKLSKAFIADACYYLKLDSSDIRIIFSPQIEPIGGISQYITFLEDETIVVSESFLEVCCAQGCTPLRTGMYEAARYISRSKKDKDWKWLTEERQDALSYAEALMFIKGLQLSCPPNIDPNLFFKPALDIIYSEFNLEAKIFRMPTKPSQGAFFYKVTLNTKEETSILKRYKQPINFTGTMPLYEQKGSINNPFDNIHQAIEYLRKQEECAYNLDSKMNEIANKGFFYDISQHFFRISWASPFVAHSRNTFPKRSFIMSQMASLDPTHPENFYFSLKPNLYRHKFLYRGQNDYFPQKPCVPNLFRDAKHNENHCYLDYLIFSQEMELMIRSHPIVQMLEHGIELCHDLFRIRTNYRGITQHYYNKSSLLDLTSDLDVVSFFATTGYDSKQDCYYPYLDTTKTGVIYYYELKYPEAFQEHKGYAMKTIGKQVFLRSGLQSGFLLDMEYGVDFKTLPEVKAVYFKHDAKLAKEIFAESENGQKYFAEDILQHVWQNRLRERYTHKIVSQDAIKLNVSRNKGETVDSITEKLKRLGISVDDYKPQFSQEELINFYKNINKWWFDFCDDIHFVDAEDEIYRQTMKELIHNPKYQQYFTYKS